MNANARRLKTGKQTPTPISEYLASIGSKGGKVSRRTLTTAQAKAMVKAREAKRPVPLCETCISPMSERLRKFLRKFADK